MSKKPKVAAGFVPRGKHPAVAVVPSEDERPRWSFACLDLDGEWGWRRLTGDDAVAVVAALRAYETMTWGEIKRRKSCGAIDRGILCANARNRLTALKLDDTDYLYKLRIARQPRIWGIRIASTLRLLWWDPEHTVYPMNIANN